MKRVLFLGVVIIMLTAAFTSPVAASTIYLPVVVTGGSVSPLAMPSGPQTYTVLTGWDNGQQGAMINAYFPSVLTIHVNDTVKWVLNSMEFHTVTFLHGADINSYPLFNVIPGNPPVVVLNVAAAAPTVASGASYDGSTFLNSGFLNPSGNPNNPTSFSLKFTATGTFKYVCLVHGTPMSGTIVVVNSSTPVLSPAQVNGKAMAEIASFQSKIGAAIADAISKEAAPVKIANGATKYTVNVGYSDSTGQIDLMNFFPSNLAVHVGDTIEWVWSNGDAPHTVTFLNGNPEPPLMIEQGGNTILNPEILFPTNDGGTLNFTDFFSSGFMPIVGTSFTLNIGTKTQLGTYDYMCLLHDTSGMLGTLQVVP